MFTLIGVGTGAAFLYSVAAVACAGPVPAVVPGHHGGMPVYFEAAAVITTLVLLGQVLELRARGRTSADIRSLLGADAQTARCVSMAGSRTSLWICPSGDRLRVRPGEECRWTAWCWMASVRWTSRC